MNLRSLVIYDIAGLEWSDDSLFFYILLSQSIGAFIGIPIAGKYHYCSSLNLILVILFLNMKVLSMILRKIMKM